MPTKQVKEENKERVALVLKELPTQPIREYEQDGKIYELLTIEESNTEQLRLLREIHKVVCGDK